MHGDRRPVSQRRRDRRIDSEGELYASPYWLRYVWATLLLLVLLEFANEALGLTGPQALYQLWFHDIVLVASTALVLYRASYEPRVRSAWFAMGLAMASWTIGSILWSAVYGNQAHPPYPTFADVLWLAWYPLMGIGIARLIKVRVPQFELHRWMDGLAVILIVLAAGFALVVQPVAAHANQGALATIVDFSYPVLDILLIGAVLGVYGLLGWRPEKVWVLIGLGIVTTTIADAAFAVREAHGASNSGGYDFVWALERAAHRLRRVGARARGPGGARRGHGPAGGRPATHRAGPGGRHPDLRPRRHRRRERTDRHVARARRFLGADHPDPPSTESRAAVP